MFISFSTLQIVICLSSPGPSSTVQCNKTHSALIFHSTSGCSAVQCSGQGTVHCTHLIDVFYCDALNGVALTAAGCVHISTAINLAVHTHSQAGESQQYTVLRSLSQALQFIVLSSKMQRCTVKCSSVQYTAVCGTSVQSR